MKKVLLILSVFFVFNSLFAQVSLSKKTLYYNGANSSDEIKLKTIIRNNSADPGDDTVVWVVAEKNLPNQWAVTFCDPIDCKNGIGLGDSREFQLNNSLGAEIELGLTFSGFAGTGNMKVIFKSKQNPAYTDTLFVTANSWTTAYKEVKKSGSEFTFYPNPVKENLHIKFPSTNESRVEIYNVLGMKVKSITNEGSNVVMNVADLKKGIYFIRITDGNTILSKQFSKVD
ncbi:MAG: T9SS type A sorting domain-containing protein [Bacteroidota bacterium]|jgi:hypothetical protein|nr:T9SS type A sorting domain-containing protein [Sphingobacteriales bacterium]